MVQILMYRLISGVSDINPETIRPRAAIFNNVEAFISTLLTDTSLLGQSPHLAGVRREPQCY
jgi:hypothetical protein